MVRLRPVVASVALLAAFGFVAVAAFGAVPQTQWAGRVAIAGVPVASEREASAEVERRSDALKKTQIRFRIAGRETPIASADAASLGIAVDRAATLRTATSAASGLTLAQRFSSSPRQEIPIAYTLDDASLLPFVGRIKEAVDEPATPARLDLDAHTVVADKNGRSVDGYALAESLRQALAEAPGTEAIDVAIPFVSYPPRLTAAVVKALDISTVVSEYETHFSRGGDQSNRGQNIDRAAARLDGLILGANQVISFNDVVGDRSEANGFKRSWEIFKGEMVEGIGGGTCQVASTFYAASFFGGLDVVEHFPHSRPSAYMPMGLDATVVFPSVDLKLRNPHPFPVVVHTKTTANSLKVELLGKERPVTVAFGRDVKDSIPFPRKVTEDPSLSGNKVVRKQHGIKGYHLDLVRTLRYASGSERVERTRGFYPPTTEIWLVPPGFDVAKLPALPTETDENATTPEASPSADGAPTAANGLPDPDLVIVEGRGTHAPSALQRNPGKRFAITR
jgi:vancomycin resistance protein YoaR